MNSISKVDLILAQNLRVRRSLKGISQYKLADMTGFPQSMIAKIETCRRKMQASELLVFANKLGVKVGDFYNDNIPLENETDN